MITEIRTERITFIAASLSYYAFVSLLPLLILGLTVASVVGGPALADSLAVGVGQSLGPSAGDLVRGALTASVAQAGASVFGLAVLVWSALKLFRGLDIAFSLVYDTPVANLSGQVRNAIVALGAVATGIAATIGVGGAIAVFELRLFGIDLLDPLGTLVLLVGLTAVFLPLYYVFPGGGVTVREALPGAAVAAVGWTVLQTGFRIYAVRAGNEAYGVLGGVLLLVTLLYFAGLVLLTGVVLNAVLAGRIDTPMSQSDSDTDSDGTDASIEKSAAPDPGPSGGGSAGTGPGPGPPGEDLEAEVAELRRRLAEFEEEIDDRTVHREELESDLRQYVRRRLRRGKARGWGPYLVLLYGTAMTLGAFYYLSGGWAILAMLVIWLSTLGLYVLFVLVGVGLAVAGAPGRLRDTIRDLRG